MIIAICRAEGTCVKVAGEVHPVPCWGVTDKPKGEPPANVVPLVYNGGRLVDANELGTVEALVEFEEEEPGEG